MANAYREIFKAPGAIAFSTTGFIARAPISMISIGLMTMFAARGDSYGNAGYVAASYVLANAIITPQISRLADRYGQARVARPATLISVASLCGLLIASHYGAPLYVLIFTAIMTGFMPSFGSFVRTRWSNLYRGSPLLRSAFAYESIVDELIFMVGPIIAIELTTRFFPSAGPLAAAIILLIGCWLFTSQKTTEPTPHPEKIEGSTSVIRLFSIQILAIMLFCIGTIFGTAEITAVALAKSLDLSHYTALPLVAYALGSFIAGITYGALQTSMPLQKQLLISVTIAAITTLPLLLVIDLWSLTIVLFIAGAACSPTIIICMSLVENIVPNEKLTEGMSWAITGMAVGVAAGAAMSGQLIDTYKPESGFYISMIGGFLAFLIALIGQHYLKPKTLMRELNNL
ncbi:MFS transporter [Bartonella tamiae]|uniref:Major facilitator superfamily (MFS) profile domain-containing protein n=1 Tax=Bartonella tamiae Th239 TaxID=1094558 RepID=J1JXB3_9HYPH|nr:MFS transporter [Bartonella tamiae]EJF89255.1 hypothetical protein ME5_01806 [Bartonella tamiae Th239]EJF95583.1 hypothetical protein MEG_00073 [Bartonella tamiae Th307]